MDFRRFVQFALQGSSNSEQNAILLARVTVGLFFASSGANKLFAVGGLKTMYETLVAPKIPFPCAVFPAVRFETDRRREIVSRSTPLNALNLLNWKRVRTGQLSLLRRSRPATCTIPSTFPSIEFVPVATANRAGPRERGDGAT